MATTAQRLIIDVDAGRLIGSFNSMVGTTQPEFTVGDTCPVEVYLVEQPGLGAPLTGVPFPAGSIVRCALGVVNAQPTSGLWGVTFGGETVSGLAYNITAEALAAELNDLAAITAAGGVTVDKVGGQFRVSFLTYGNKGLFSAAGNTLVPASDLQIQTLQEGSSVTNEVVMLNLSLRPIALNYSFTDLDPITASTTPSTFTINGGVASGTYRLNLSWGQNGITYNVTTNAIQYTANIGDVSQAVFDALVNNGWGTELNNLTSNTWGVTVTELSPETSRIDFTAPTFTTPIPVVAPTITGIDVTELFPLVGKKAELNLNTVEALAYLGTDERARCVLEIEVEAAGNVQTLLQTGCTLLGQVIYAGTFAPIPLTVPMSEAVADARFLRRDIDQSLDSTTRNQVWENLTGVTSPTGVDLVGALTNASAPTASNPFATLDDVGVFNQSLNTTDAVIFTGLRLTAGGLIFPDNSTQTTALSGDTLLSKAGNLAGLANLATSRANLGLGTMATEATTAWLSKAGNLAGLTNTVTARNNLGLGISSDVTFNYLQVTTSGSFGNSIYINNNEQDVAAASAPDDNDYNYLPMWDGNNGRYVPAHYLDPGQKIGLLTRGAGAWGAVADVGYNNGTGDVAAIRISNDAVSFTELRGDGVRFPDGTLQTTSASGTLGYSYDYTSQPWTLTTTGSGGTASTMVESAFTKTLVSPHHGTADISLDLGVGNTSVILKSAPNESFFFTPWEFIFSWKSTSTLSADSLLTQEMGFTYNDSGTQRMAAGVRMQGYSVGSNNIKLVYVNDFGVETVVSTGASFINNGGFFKLKCDGAGGLKLFFSSNPSNAVQVWVEIASVTTAYGESPAFFCPSFLRVRAETSNVGTNNRTLTMGNALFRYSNGY